MKSVRALTPEKSALSAHVSWEVWVKMKFRPRNRSIMWPELCFAAAGTALESLEAGCDVGFDA